MSRIFTTTLRLNLADEDDRRAFEYLRRMNKKQYRSYRKAIVAAVNDHFDRQEQLAADPYLETREKEDAFLRQVMEVVAAGLRSAPTPKPPAPAIVLTAAQDNEDMAAALDFADSF